MTRGTELSSLIWLPGTDPSKTLCDIGAPCPHPPMACPCEWRNCWKCSGPTLRCITRSATLPGAAGATGTPLPTAGAALPRSGTTGWLIMTEPEDGMADGGSLGIAALGGGATVAGDDGCGFCDGGGCCGCCSSPGFFFGRGITGPSSVPDWATTRTPELGSDTGVASRDAANAA